MYNNIFDSHAHYDDEQFDADRDEVISSLKDSGVTCVINISCNMKTSENIINLVDRYDFFYGAVGIHPHDAKDFKEADLSRLSELSKHTKVVAIGEIGLDYHYDFSPRDVQKSVFRKQMELAEKLNLPVVIHMREATEDTLSILQDFKGNGVVHCYSGSAETAKILLSMGYHIGFTGAVTFKNAKKAIEAVSVIPTDRLLLETDCPYMAPVPHRGERCDSRLIYKTAEKLAEIKGMDTQELINIMTANTCRLFNI